MSFLQRDSTRQIANIIAFVATVVINFISQAIPFNGQTNADIANRYPVYFLPANYVFGIWGIIYLGLLAFTIYQALPSQRENSLMRRIGYWFVVTCIGNIGWIFAFQYDFYALSMLPIVLLLVALIAIHLRLNIGKEKVSNRDHWLVHVPHSIYLGWISVAVIANATYTLYVGGWQDPSSGQLAANVMLAIGAVLAGAMVFMRNTPVFAIVVIWAFAGIYARHGGDPAAASVGIFAAVMSVIVGAIILVWLFTRNRNQEQRAFATGY